MEAQGNGKPLTPLDPSHTSVYRTDGMHAFSVPTEMAGRMIRIDLLVHHRWAQSAWIHEPPRLSASNHGDRAYMRAVAFNRATDVAALVLLLSAGFTYLILFSLERTRRAHLFYAIQLIAAAAYPLFWSGLLQPILGPAEIPLLGVLLAVAAVAGVYCIHAYFDLETPSPAWIVGVGAVAVVAMIAPGPFESTRWVAAAALAVLATAASYLIVRLARIARSPRRPINTLTFLGCWGLLALCMAPDGLHWLGAWSGVPTTGGLNQPVVCTGTRLDLEQPAVVHVPRDHQHVEGGPRERLPDSSVLVGVVRRGAVLPVAGRHPERLPQHQDPRSGPLGRPLLELDELRLAHHLSVPVHEGGAAGADVRDEKAQGGTSMRYERVPGATGVGLRAPWNRSRVSRAAGSCSLRCGSRARRHMRLGTNPLPSTSG